MKALKRLKRLKRLKSGSILLAFDGLTNEEIAAKLRCERHGVGLGRKRWQRAFPRLTVVECVENPPALREAIEGVLGDLPRAGCGGKFTAEPIAQILAVACEPPEQSGRPVTHGTPRELADEAVKRGIATSISVRQVGRFLKGGGAPAPQEPVLAQRRSQGRGRLRATTRRRPLPRLRLGRQHRHHARLSRRNCRASINTA